MTEKMRFDAPGVIEGARACIPIAAGVTSYGLVFGVLARQVGLSVPEIAAMSAIVFAGSAQFVAVDMWSSPLPVVAVIATTFVINLRHLLMGAGIQPWFADRSAAETYGSAFFMTDENWALTVGALRDGSTNAAFLLGSGLAVFGAWIGATTVGASLGGVVGDPADYGFDFAFTAVFLTLLVGLRTERSYLLPWAVAAGVAIATSVFVPGSWYVLFGGLAGSVTAVVVDVD